MEQSSVKTRFVWVVLNRHLGRAATFNPGFLYKVCSFLPNAGMCLGDGGLFFFGFVYCQVVCVCGWFLVFFLLLCRVQRVGFFIPPLALI